MGSDAVTVVGSFAVGLSLRSERFPVAGQTVLARDFDQGPGGKGSNQAIQVARAGGSVEFIGVVGRDDFGDGALRLWSREGVGTRFVRRVEERNTGVGFILLDAAGDNRIMLDPGANELLLPADVAAARNAVADSAVVVTQLEVPTETAAAGLASGRSHGARTILNPAPARPIDPAVMRDADILTPNQGEARVLLGLEPDDPSDDRDICARLLDLGVATVVLTRGREGALVVTPGGTETVSAFPVEVVDSTGAGDAFTGTLAAALAAGRSLSEAARRAAAAGALACTRLGVVPSLPYADDVDRMTEGVT